MKKTFTLSHPKIKPARMVDAIKHEIKKYLKRERNKALPQGSDYWDFDCKFGYAEAESTKVNVSALNKLIDSAVAKEKMSFYVEILANASNKEARTLVDDQAKNH
jgi:hypothetical protein